MKEQPLLLSDVSTGIMTLNPTKENLKPVIVLQSKLTTDLAARLRLAWLFDPLGNPNPFKNSVGSELMYTGPVVHLQGGGTKLSIQAQKIKSISVHHGDGEDKELYLQMSVHLQPVDGGDKQALAKLFETVTFLVQLNKAAFDVSIDPAQQTLFPAENAPAPGGIQGMDFDFKAKVGRKDGIVGKVMIAPAAGGMYQAGWEIRCPGFKDEPVAGEQITEESQLFETSDAALTYGCDEVLKFMNQGLDADTTDQDKAIETVRQWIFTRVPGLKVSLAS
jgi:hypothetical protein